MMVEVKSKNFQDLCDELGIGEYADRIWHSNSHGELFHLHDYVRFYNALQEAPDTKPIMLKVFEKFFVDMVEYAEKNWKRPESVFQHIMPEFTKCLFEIKRDGELKREGINEDS